MTTERKRVFLAVTHFVVDCFGRDIESRALAVECVQFKRKRSRVVRVHNGRNLAKDRKKFFSENEADGARKLAKDRASTELYSALSSHFFT